MEFPQKLVNEPILYNISIKFGILFNIARANVSESQGKLELSLEGDANKLVLALNYLKERGVEIKEVPAPITTSSSSD